MQTDLESEEVSDFNRFREWWYAINPATINPVVVFTHIEKYFKPKWQAPPVEQTVDAGQLFDENAADVHHNDWIKIITREKFIELWNQRTPDAAQLEKIIDDAFQAGQKREYHEFKRAYNDVYKWEEAEEHISTKSQYIKQAIEQFNNLKK